jgi:WD repeat-containing protein 26
MTTVFTAFSSFGLAAVSAWFASERWIFSRHKGKKWLQDLLDDWWDAVISIPPFHQFLDGLHAFGLWSSSIPHHTRVALTHTRTPVTSIFRRRPAGSFNSSSENSLPSVPSPETVVAIPQSSRRGSEIVLSASPVSPTFEPKSVQGSTVSFTLPSEKSSGMSGTPTTSAPSRRRFAQAVRNVIRMQQATQLTRSLSPTLLMSDGTRRQDTLPMPMQASRVAGLVPKLRGLMPTQVLEAHQALVRHLQFSPNGKFLATSRLVSGREKNTWRTDDSECHSWDHTSVIFQAGVSTCLSSWLVCD